MSWVSNLIISVGIGDAKYVEQLSEWLETEAPQRHGPGDVNHEARVARLLGAESFIRHGPGVGSLGLLTAIDPVTKEARHHWGGWKNPQCRVWGGALNHADLSAVLARIAEIPWRDRELVQVLLRDEEEFQFSLYMYRDGQWRQYTPPLPADYEVWLATPDDPL